ncbi:unnamed protein product [Choristocarpus tenellus]
MQRCPRNSCCWTSGEWAWKGTNRFSATNPWLDKLYIPFFSNSVPTPVHISIGFKNSIFALIVHQEGQPLQPFENGHAGTMQQYQEMELAHKQYTHLQQQHAQQTQMQQTAFVGHGGVGQYGNGHQSGYHHDCGPWQPGVATPASVASLPTTSQTTQWNNPAMMPIQPMLGPAVPVSGLSVSSQPTLALGPSKAHGHQMQQLTAPIASESGPIFYPPPQSVGLAPTRMEQQWMMGSVVPRPLLTPLPPNGFPTTSQGGPYLQLNLAYPGLQKLVDIPPVFIVNDFFTAAECEALMVLAQNYMVVSPVVGQGAGEVSASRTSSSCFLAREDLPSVCSKVVALTGKPVDHLELPQVGRYFASQQYANHWDAFDLSTEDGRRFAQNGGQRVCTVLVYLNDVGVGGCTCFPKLRLRIQPKRGMAVVFFPASLDGRLDVDALHAAEPAVETKWVSQIWIRQQSYQGTPSAHIPQI